MKPFEFRTVPKIVCEAGASDRMADVLSPCFAEKGVCAGANLFVLVDPFIAGTPKFKVLTDSLIQAGYHLTINQDIEPDPPEALVHRIVATANASDAKAVIAVGGGSTLDVAKLVAILVKGEQPLETMYGVGMVKSSRLPLVLCPTTSGTGSEVTPISIVTTGADTKMGVVSPQLYGDLAVLDADWTLSLPKAVTAATGIDAMVHAIEAFTSKRLKNRYSDFLATEALRLLTGNLLTVCSDPGNREARQAMMLGACMAGQAFANAPVGGVHALAYPIGGIFHVSHGLSNSLVLPEVIKFNAKAALDQYAELSLIVGVGQYGNSDQKNCDAFVDFCANLSPSTGLPSRLRDVGIGESDLDRMAESAMLQTRLLSNNPCEINQKEARDIYAASL